MTIPRLLLTAAGFCFAAAVLLPLAGAPPHVVLYFAIAGTVATALALMF